MERKLLRHSFVSSTNFTTNITSIPSSFPTSNPTPGYYLPEEVYIGGIVAICAAGLFVVLGFLNCASKRNFFLLDSCSLFFSISFWFFLVILLCFAGSCNFGYCCNTCFECSCAVTTPGVKNNCSGPKCSECVGYDGSDCSIQRYNLEMVVQLDDA